MRNPAVGYLDAVNIVDSKGDHLARMEHGQFDLGAAARRD